MKRIFITILILAFGQSMVSQEKVNEFSFEYEAISRGLYQKTKVNREKLTVSEDRGGKKSSTIKISNIQWKELVDLANKIKFEELSSLMAPSEKRKFDGAAHAQLKVFFKDDIFESYSFDYGNPPSEIKNLVEYIIKLGKSANKI